MRKPKGKKYMTRKQLMKKTNKLNHELKNITKEYDELLIKYQRGYKNLKALCNQVRSLEIKLKLVENRSHSGVISKHLMKIGL